MPRVTIIIPTIGTARTKKKSSPEVQRVLWRKMAGNVIRRSIVSAKNAGYSSRILLVDSSDAGISKSALAALSFQARQEGVSFESIHRPKTGLMEGFMVGARHAIETHAPDILVMNIDDYQTEAKSLENLLKPFTRKTSRPDFVTGSRGIKSIYSFPRAQILNETQMSRLVTFANPEVPLVQNSFAQTIQNAVAKGKAIQTYTTFSAMTPQAFQKLDRYIRTHFQSVLSQIQMIGLEPLMLAAAEANRMRVENAEIARRFEHAYPKSIAQQTAFFNSRRRQFEEGAKGVRAVLEDTGQTTKIPVFDRVVAQTIARLTPLQTPQSQARFRLPRNWKKGSKSRLRKVLARKKR